jgi:hypothetical protein
MGTGPGRSEELCNGGNEDARAPTPTELRLQYKAPTLTVYGSLVDLTQKRGGPGRDNPHFQKSF